MIKNYLKIAGKHLWKHKAYVLINLLGIGVGLAMCILAYLTWDFDRSFDRFHAKDDHIFRVTTTKTNSHQLHGVSPRALAASAEEQIAGVQAGIMLDGRDLVVTNGKDINREDITFTEPDFFNWLSFQLIAGKADLSDPNNLIITEKLALKYFGIDDPIGQTLTLNPTGKRKDLTVSGVIKDLPLVGFLVAVVLGTTILAAAYPALYVSAFSPGKIFRGSVTLAGNNSLSRILLGAQVVISALTIVSGISFARNADFQQTADLGFDREGIQAIFVPNEQTYQVMEQMAKQWPEVASVADSFSATHGIHHHYQSTL